MSDRVYRYEWSKGFSAPVTAETAFRELVRIANDNGLVDPQFVPPELVLEASRSASAVLHPVFEWDNSVAAEKHRVAQARRMISAMRVIRRETRVPEPAFAYIRVGEKGDRSGRAFVPMVSIVDDPGRRRAFLLGELRNIAGCLDRTLAFAEMDPLRDALAAVKAGLAGDQEAVQDTG